MVTHTTALAGVGIGFRQPFAKQILQLLPDIPWFEALTDNYLTEGGLSRAQLLAAREHYPIALHGVGMSLGSVNGLSTSHVQKVKQLADQLEAAHVSEHLCWSHNQTHYSHELLPLPFTEEAVKTCVANISQAQDILDRTLLIENVSAYMSFDESELTEVEFVNVIAEQTDCHILLDINNVYVNSINLGLSADHYLSTINSNRVKEIHLGGYEDKDDHLLDSHSRPVSDPVWKLYQQWCQRHPNTPALIEWDNDLPDFATLLAQRQQAAAIQCQT